MILYYLREPRQLILFGQSCVVDAGRGRYRSPSSAYVSPADVDCAVDFNVHLMGSGHERSSLSSGTSVYDQAGSTVDARSKEPIHLDQKGSSIHITEDEPDRSLSSQVNFFRKVGWGSALVLAISSLVVLVVLGISNLSLAHRSG